MWQGMAITGRCAIDGIADCSGNAFSIAGSIGMSLFASFGNELSYEDVIQLDGAFAATHVNYGKAPLLATGSRERNSSSLQVYLSRKRWNVFAQLTEPLPILA